MITKRVCSSRSISRTGRETILPMTLAIALVFVGATHAIAQTPEPAAPASSLLPGAEEGFVDSGDVKIHYVSLGKKEDPLWSWSMGFPISGIPGVLRCPRSPSNFTSSRSTSGAIT